VPPQPTAAAVSAATHFKVNNLTLWLCTLAVALFYAFYSTRSNGFYQQDEAGHFISMLDFWHQPNIILSNWAKPGYKLIYVVPTLLGKNAVRILNCIFAAMTGFLAYRIAEKLGSNRPMIAFLLLITQPLWVSLSFRNYSEIPSAFLLALAVYLHVIQLRGSH
jgi:4-amino-4-deoxy-L-arabinose transferase-like glycosyltransferase